jgi:hypothetical protein
MKVVKNISYLKAPTKRYRIRYAISHAISYAISHAISYVILLKHKLYPVNAHRGAASRSSTCTSVMLTMKQEEQEELEPGRRGSKHTKPQVNISCI